MIVSIARTKAAVKRGFIARCYQLFHQPVRFRITHLPQIIERIPSEEPIKWRYFH